MLAVDIHQQIAQGAEGLQRYLTVVDPCAGATVGTDAAPDQAEFRLVGFECVLAEPQPGTGQPADVEFSADVCPIAAAAHNLAIGAVIAPRMMDLPAPVSPVSTVMPLANSISSCSAIA